MLSGKKICVVMPAYNAASTLQKTLAEIDRTVVDDIILVDDASQDGTAQAARYLGLRTLVHPKNRGYGGNQKTCYTEALRTGADVVVVVMGGQHGTELAGPGHHRGQHRRRLRSIHHRRLPLGRAARDGQEVSVIIMQASNRQHRQHAPMLAGLPGGFASKKKGVQGEHSPRATSTGLIAAEGKREPEGGTVGSFLEGAGAAAPPLFDAKPSRGTG